MKTINAKSLLTVSILAGTSFILSCGGGGTSSNGFTQNGYYTLSANMTVANPPVYSVNTDYSIPQDVWNININLTYTGNTSTLSNTNAYITSASICFGDPTIPGGQCQPVPLKTYVLPINSNITESIAMPNNYKLGMLGLIANPYQNTNSGASSSIQLTTLSSTTLNYKNYLTLSPNLSPGSLQIGFNASYQIYASNSSITSITNIYSNGAFVSSSTSFSNISSTAIPYSTIISGFCIDNGNGGFYQQASGVPASYNITCNGSINYTNGTISNFSINLPSTLAISNTYSSLQSITSSLTNTSSTASSSTIILSSTTTSLSLSQGYLSPSISINYAVLNGTNSGNYFYAYLSPLPTNPYYYLYYVPQYIVAGSNTIPCSQYSCQVNQTPNGYILQIQNQNISGANAYAILSKNITYNPSLTIPFHQQASLIPYIFYITTELPDGDTMSTSFSSYITVESP